MFKKQHFLIVDDDEEILHLFKILLEQEGHEVTGVSSSIQALKVIPQIQPDCILSDLMMPELDGLELFEHVKKIEDIKKPKFIIITVKQYDFDRRRALKAGIDGFICKPINPVSFLSEIYAIIESEMIIKFWGVRGTLPVPGKETVRYGGNTNCVTLEIGKHFFIFDAGTGIKALSNYLMQQNIFPISAKIFITHPHYDHINGFPFFVPFYMKDNEFEIFGPKNSGIDIQKSLEGQMDCIYFPITMKEFLSTVNFRNVSEESFYIDDICITTMYLNHPGKCVGYQIKYKNKIFCYVTDNEIPLENSPAYSQFDIDRLIKFIQNADLVVIDATYDDKQFSKKIFWGHSSVSRVIDIVDEAKVKHVCLYHHDPDQTDKDIDMKLEHAQLLLKERKSNTVCTAPHEGDTLAI
jgi:phosphoribosyl 1,2-cyclic phosphodiesterase